MVTRTFGQYLKQEREARGFGLRELALACDLSPGYLSKIETGSVPIPSRGVLSVLASRLEIAEDTMLTAGGYITDSLKACIASNPDAVKAILASLEGRTQVELDSLVRRVKDGDW